MQRIIVALLLFAALFAPQAVAAPRLTAAQAADEALRAIAGGNEGALRRVARLFRPDVWSTADVLWLRGERDAARALAAAAGSEDAAALPAYLGKRAAMGPEEGHRRAHEKARALLSASKPSEASALLGGLEKPRDPLLAVRLDLLRGEALLAAGEHERAEQSFVAAAKAAEELGWLEGACHGLHLAAVSSFSQRASDRVLAHFRSRERIEALRGNANGVASARANIGSELYVRGKLEKARTVITAALETKRKLGDARTIPVLLLNLGHIEWKTKRLEAAEQRYAESRTLATEAGLPRTVIDAWHGSANVLRDRGLLHEAVGAAQQALEGAKRLRDPLVLADAWGQVGLALLMAGREPEAVAALERGAAPVRRRRDPAGVVKTLGNLGLAYQKVGEPARALSAHEEALALATAMGFGEGMLQAENNLTSLCVALGDLEAALAHGKRGIELAGRADDALSEAISEVNLADVLRKLGRLEEAREHEDRGLRLHEEAGHPINFPRALLGAAQGRNADGRTEEAVALVERALEMARSHGNAGEHARILLQLGTFERDLGRREKARSHFAEALELAGRAGAVETEARAHWRLARWHFDVEDIGPVLEHARAAVLAQEKMMRGFGAFEGVRARERWSQLFGLGFIGACAKQQVAEAAWFLERARAASLREALDDPGMLRRFAHDPAALRAQDEARRTESLARTALERARKQGGLSATNAARRQYEAARAARVALAERMGREAALSGDLSGVDAASLRDVQGALRPGEALVLYAVYGPQVLAVVVEPDSARAVATAERIADVRNVLQDVDFGNPGSEPQDAVQQLQALLVAPLALGDRVRRVYVSPHVDLVRVPFVMLMPGREVAYAPSGTLLAWLRKGPVARGRRVLALGDPDYGHRPGAEAGAGAAGARAARFGSLARLPASGEEARAIGDITLTGKDASEAKLAEALMQQERWRSVHFACHGLLHLEKPELSCLALARDEDHDGLLTSQEVMALDVRADLAVLSACQTAAGKSFRTEGVVSLARAFIHAGSRGVLCSLWDVDDEATKALMLKFYELWNPRPAAAKGADPGAADGLSAAAALREAQAFVRSQEKWEHPYFWAAWVLWGAGD